MTLVGWIGSVAVVAGGALAGAAAPGDGRLWAVPTVPAQPSVDLVIALTAFYGGLIVLSRAWLRLRRDAPTHDASMLAVVLVVLLWALPMLVGPPLGSRDVYAYAAQGRLADEGFDVYTQGPAALGDDPVLDPVDPIYLEAPVLYGPVFVAISAAVSASTGGEAVYSVLAFRALAVLGLVVAAIGVVDIAGALGRDRRDALILAVANPLVLLHLVSGAHNEALMLAFLVAGVAIGLRPRFRHVGIMCCAFAAAIKMPAILGVAFLAWPWVTAVRPAHRRGLRLGIAAAEAFLVLAFAGQLTGWGWGWVDAVTAAKPVNAYLSISRIVGGAAHLVFGGDGVAALTAARLIALLAAALISTWLLLQATNSLVTALALSLLVVAVLHPTTQPWYLTWGLLLWAATSAGTSNKPYLAVTAAAAFLVMPVGPHLGQALVDNSGLFSLVLAAALLALLTLSPGAARVSRRRRQLDPRLVSVIIPTRNEASNVEELASRVLASVSESVELLFVDDSDDHTPEVLASMSASDRRVRVIHRAADERWGGLGGAVAEGFERASGARVVVIDGDLQHPPEKIPELLGALDGSAEVAVASRRVQGGSCGQGLTASRRVLSSGTTVATQVLFPTTVGRVADPLSGFFAVDLAAIDLAALHPDGFKILLELLATQPDVRVVEFPYSFAARSNGESKAGGVEGARFVGHLIDLRLRTSWPWAGVSNSARQRQSPSLVSSAPSHS